MLHCACKNTVLLQLSFLVGFRVTWNLLWVCVYVKLAGRIQCFTQVSGAWYILRIHTESLSEASFWHAAAPCYYWVHVHNDCSVPVFSISLICRQFKVRTRLYSVLNSGLWFSFDFSAAGIRLGMHRLWQAGCTGYLNVYTHCCRTILSFKLNYMTVQSLP